MSTQSHMLNFPLPDGCVELTDPKHIVRCGIDRFLCERNFGPSNELFGDSPWQMVLVSNGLATIGDWIAANHNIQYRFCCSESYDPEVARSLTYEQWVEKYRPNHAKYIDEIRSCKDDMKWMGAIADYPEKYHEVMMAYDYRRARNCQP